MTLDTIMVIDGGCIVEQGSHETLIKKGGTYRRMFKSQFKNMEIALFGPVDRRGKKR
ncbi:hypothetical protein BSNK01_18790 [Bacillaceae bacterium]